MSYQNDAKKLLELIGGKENIQSVTHCVTRMRFVLKDPKKANEPEIEKLDSVKGLFTQSGQFQVIIGNKVPEFYNDFVSVSGVEGVSKEALKEDSKKQQNWLQQLMSNIAEIFAPLIPALIVGGLILGFRNVIGDINMFDTNGKFTTNLSNATQTLVMVSPFFSGLHHFLWLIGEAIFHFLPVGITWSITRKMGTTQILGIVLGLTLVSPQLLNAYGASAALANGTVPYWDFGSFKVQMIGYQAQVIPAILAGFTLVYVERFFRKITPEMISMIVVPFFALIISVIVAHLLLGPIGWKIGSAISSVVYKGLTSNFKVVFSGIFGFFYAPLVITGLHHMTNAIDLQLIADFGGTMLWPMIALSNIAQGSTILGMILLQRRNKKAQELNYSSMISAYLGVTEPAMFGVNLKYVFPFFAAATGSALAAMFSVGTGVVANSIGVGGLPGILSIKIGYYLLFAIAMLIAIVVPCLITYVIGKRKGIK